MSTPISCWMDDHQFMNTAEFIRTPFIDFIFLFTSGAGSILSLWISSIWFLAIQAVNVRCGLPLVDLKLAQSLVGHLHKLCAFISTAHLTSRAGCGLKVLWLSWCSSPTTGRLAWIHKMAAQTLCHPGIGILASVIHIDSRDFPLHYVSTSFLPHLMLPSSSHPFQYFLPPYHACLSPLSKYSVGGGIS